MSKSTPSVPRGHFGGRPLIRNPYNYDAKQASNATALRDFDPGFTRQEMREEADINTIVRNFGLGKPIPYTSKVPTFGDFDQVSDYREAIDVVRQAEEAFAALPAKVRDELANEPQKLIEAASSKDAVAKFRAWGLIPTPEEGKPSSATPPAG